MSDEIENVEENDTPKAEKPSAELSEDILDQVAGGTTTLSNIAKLQHDMQKGVANNTRA
jgi:hypothetical protein